MIVISIIVPHRDSVQLLPKLFSSIPERDDIEIIIVDNSDIPITKESISIDREYTLLHSPLTKYAGGARNVGLEHARGKWILFLDADDYFAVGTFDFYLSKQNSEADIIYTCMAGAYLDTGKPCDRGSYYTNLIKGYLDGKESENELRLRFDSPCCKLIRKDLISDYKLRFDEIVAGNDAYFSLLCGYYAKKIEAYDVVTYIATISRGTLTKRRDFPVLEARLYSNLHYNQFVKAHNIGEWQKSVVFPFFDGKHLGLKAFIKFIKMIVRFRQNPFIGMNNWLNTIIISKKNKSKDSIYITK